MKARFIEQPGGPRETVTHGKTFPAGEWVDVPDNSVAARKLANHPSFEVKGAPKGLVHDDEPEVSAETPPNPDEVEQEPTDVAGLRALLDERGIEYDPRLGAKRLKALLDERKLEVDPDPEHLPQAG